MPKLVRRLRRYVNSPAVIFATVAAASPDTTKEGRANSPRMATIMKRKYRIPARREVAFNESMVCVDFKGLHVGIRQAS